MQLGKIGTDPLLKTLINYQLASARYREVDWSGCSKAEVKRRWGIPRGKFPSLNRHLCKKQRINADLVENFRSKGS
ncbi:hypothetical protein AAFF_G00045370 [Aldrovandia affinis]|uniref:Uncharacterized protein n=1 Tax=Aldrovandia affinis TaxID=143900 RepID=A0AAD7WEX8_9TELE|nr:hypothetical protein AAFF_G00045370 [Aldrovandia affinis]